MDTSPSSDPALQPEHVCGAPLGHSLCHRCPCCFLLSRPSSLLLADFPSYPSRISSQGLLPASPPSTPPAGWRHFSLLPRPQHHIVFLKEAATKFPKGRLGHRILIHYPSLLFSPFPRSLTLLYISQSICHLLMYHILFIRTLLLYCLSPCQASQGQGSFTYVH